MANAAPPDLTKPLSSQENMLLDNLLARRHAGQAPGERVGQPHRALVNLSLPRIGDPQKQTDLVMAGDTVNLTTEEAAKINRQHPVPVVVPVSDTESQPPRPRTLSGPLYAPPPPAKGTDLPRPDPPGSSHLIQAEVRIPEGGEPQIGEMDPSTAEAVDIPPRPRGSARR